MKRELPAVREVMPVPANAETVILVTESGRQRLVRWLQPRKSRSGISVRVDGGSNVTDGNLAH
jgi:hypothetical protein